MMPPWLEPQMQQLRAAFAAGRMPHALLIHESPGAGGESLAYWAAQLVLCSTPATAPCGHCAGCHHVQDRQHPDLISVVPLGDSAQIRIEQLRELAADLALTAHQGGYKVGVLSPADSMNRFAANALLKTLEEPPPGTLLVLVASVPSRLPVTIASRCQRLRVPPPARAAAVAWLTAERGAADWEQVLKVLGDAPLDAAASDPAAVMATAGETRRELEEIAGGQGDAGASAERWARGELGLRLACFETWLTDRIRAELTGVAVAPEMRASAHRRTSALTIKGAFELLDAVRELRSSLDVPINKGVALEAVLRSLAPHRTA
jgi:DNA polymerase-3 subunit delta'